MTGSWQPSDTVPDRWLMSLEAGAASIDEVCDALAEYDWPDANPALEEPGADPHPPGGWVRSVDAAHRDGRISDGQYEAIYLACGPHRG